MTTDTPPSGLQEQTPPASGPSDDERRQWHLDVQQMRRAVRTHAQKGYVRHDMPVVEGLTAAIESAALILEFAQTHAGHHGGSSQSN